MISSTLVNIQTHIYTDSILTSFTWKPEPAELKQYNNDSDVKIMNTAVSQTLIDI